ncbi:MAG: glycosyltransferase family 4 protein [Bacteroidota bacterium]|nr:glycosyltransferase family 4 protein [Bacteroidota bacterium]MDP4232124.1 glycosyltransferase family 4 protein [Bacteroidota bacterium]MDP4241168.1 glycosyltransferase family 4 protein [Bacteroidota bacterium]MDP4286560.1 glycosyltransferase family 4 protein [Bacteroidota bacterium]
MEVGYQSPAIAVIGNHLPRQCGIATFTTDLCEALAAEGSGTECIVIAVTDTEEGYKYPPAVRFELVESNPESYLQAASFLNVSGANIVSLQHEYGIFGGPDGSYIIPLLERLRIPVVTTLHTVLERPSKGQYDVLKQIAALSSRLIVMTQRSVDILTREYDIPHGQIDFIPHGVLDTPFLEPDDGKKALGFEGKKLLLTSGLLSPNKGIEHVIDAMPRILKRHPNAMYVVLGSTHPNVKRNAKEGYRDSLVELARELGVLQHVYFHNAFVDRKEFGDFMDAADIFITPYNSAGQAVSGVLSQALGTGKAIISTPYLYAKEMLSHGRGILVRFHNSRAIAREVIDLLNHPFRSMKLRHAAYEAGREMIWSRVARAYFVSFQRALATVRNTGRIPQWTK